MNTAFHIAFAASKLKCRVRELEAKRDLVNIELNEVEMELQKLQVVKQRMRVYGRPYITLPHARRLA